jgi:hypothetical protein
MIVVGTVSTDEEHRELRFIAEMFILGERFRTLAREQCRK